MPTGHFNLYNCNNNCKDSYGSVKIIGDNCKKEKIMQTEIAEILNNMREENQRNIENFEKVLSGINTKLEAMGEDNEAVDLVRFYIAELKKAMEDRFSAALIRYDAFEASFDGIITAQAELAKTSELKDLFGVFSAHNDAFMTEIASQKNLLDILDAKLSQIDEKSIDKEELSSMVQDVSLDLSVLGENIQKTFSQVEEKVNDLDMSERLDSINEAVQELKGFTVPDYSEEFQNLEKNLENILTEADFANFREDLGDFVQKIIDNSSALNSELSFSTERILDSVNSIDYSDLKDDLSVIRGSLDDLKEVSYQAAFDDVLAVLSDIRNNLDELQAVSYQPSFDEINGFLVRICEDIQTLRASIGADVQENYGAVKVGLDELIVNLHDIKDDLSTVAEDIKENSNNNYNALKDYVEEVSSNMGSLLDSVSVLKTDTVISREKLYEINEKIDKFEPVDYSYDLQQISSKLDDLTDENSSISANIEEKFENIKELVESLDNSEAVKLQFEGFEKAFGQIVTVDDFSHFKSEFAEFLQKIIDNSTVLYENSNFAKEQNREEFEKVNNAIEKINSNSELNFGDLKNSFEKVVSEISEIKDDFAQKNDANVFNISTGFDNVKMSLENVVSALHSMGASNESVEALDEKINRLNDVVSTLSTDLSLKQDEVVQHISDSDEIRLSQMKSVSDNIDSLRGYIDEGVECLKNYMAELEVSANSAKTAGDEKLTQKLLDLESSLVQSTSEYEQKMELLQAKITEFAHIVENSNSDTEGKIASSLDEIQCIKSELEILNDGLKSSKVSVDEKFGETVSLIDAGIENIIFNLTNLSDNVVNGVNVSFKENVSGIDEKFDNLFEIINEVKNQHTLNNVDLIQDIENKVTALKDELGLINSDIAGALECKSEEIIRAFEPVKTGIEEFAGFDFEKILTSLKSEIELAFMNFTVDINTEFASNSQTVSRLEQAFKDTFNKLSDIEECIHEKVQDNIELLNVSLENSFREIKVNLEGKIEDQISELRDYFDVALNNNNIESSISDLKDSFSLKVDEINTKLDVIVTDTALDDLRDDFGSQFSEISSKLDIIVSDTAVEELHDRFDEILENNGKISASVQQFNGRFDNLSQTEAQVSDMISALHAKVDALVDDSSDFDILEEIDGIKDIIFEQRKFFEVSSDEKASAIDKYLRDVLLKLDNVDLERNAEDIKESILGALVSLVDQISFVEETEEIKDFVEEKTEEINQNLIDVKNQLKQLTSPGDDFDYTYTLQDVESDIAKLRLAVTNMSGNDFSEVTDEIKKIVDAVEGLENSLTQEQIVDLKSDIEKLNEDIVSISSRTNKLLLTSDESYKALNDGLNNFSNIVYRLEDKLNTDTSDRIERKIDSIHSLAVEADNANKVSRQVMMYLGEWIDSAGENISEISEKTAEIESIKENIQELRETVPEKGEILDEIERRFEKQEQRIDRLEMGLDKVLSLLEQKDVTILESKVDNIERMLSVLGTNIEKLTSYVDEE